MAGHDEGEEGDNYEVVGNVDVASYALGVDIHGAERGAGEEPRSRPHEKQ